MRLTNPAQIAAWPTAATSRRAAAIMSLVRIRNDKFEIRTESQKTMMNVPNGLQDSLFRFGVCFGFRVWSLGFFS